MARQGPAYDGGGWGKDSLQDGHGEDYAPGGHHLHRLDEKAEERLDDLQRDWQRYHDTWRRHPSTPKVDPFTQDYAKPSLRGRPRPRILDDPEAPADEKEAAFAAWSQPIHKDTNLVR